MRGSKIPVQELWLKMGGGRIREGGGVIAGFYGIMNMQMKHSIRIFQRSIPITLMHLPARISHKS